MVKFTSQWDFFGTSGMHYMANLSTTAFDETPEDLFHNYHLDLQERMQNPIAFHAEMTGDIMYYDQALQQPDACRRPSGPKPEIQHDQRGRGVPTLT
jgi:hypothetical protein